MVQSENAANISLSESFPVSISLAELNVSNGLITFSALFSAAVEYSDYASTEG